LAVCLGQFLELYNGRVNIGRKNIIGPNIPLLKTIIRILLGGDPFVRNFEYFSKEAKWSW